MKSRKIIASLLIIAIMISLMPTKIFALNELKLTITPSVTEAHPGDVITYTVKMSAVQNLAGMKFKIIIPEGLTFVEGKEVDDLQETLHAAKAEFTPSTKVFVVGSSNYSSDEETVLMTFKCSVDTGTTGNKEITFEIDEDDIFDTTPAMNNIPVDYSDTGSVVNITPIPVPATGITLNKTTLTLEIGTDETLNAIVAPENSTDTITWRSSDTTKATVDSNGKVTAVAEGTVNITVETSSGKTATCEVTIIKPICKHLNKSTVSAKEPTCTAEGNNEYKVCDDCGKLFKVDGTTETTIEAETIEALGHDFSIPRHDENQHWNECSRCSIADTKINHIGEGEYQSDSTSHWKVCGCGVKVDEEAHQASTPVKENRHAATCTEGGTYDEVIYCSVCNYEMSRTPKTEPATGHTAGTPVQENIVAATCTEGGTYDEVVYCTVCGDEVSRTPKTEPAKGHTAGTPVQENIVPATHTTKGSYDEVIYCSVCNAEISRTAKETPMVPNVVWSHDEENHWKVCGCDTIVDLAPHTAGDPVRENVVAATCTEGGTYDEVIYCSVCNHEMSRTSKTISATGHTAGTPVHENIVQPTCTKDGSHDEVVYCTICNEELSRTAKVDEATGHVNGNPVKENVHDATCTEEGSYDEVIYCDKCNEKLTTTPKTIPAKGHTEGAVVIENEIESTVDKEGSYDEVVYCVDCHTELSRTKKTTPKFVYEILEGAGASHEDEGSDTITIRANGKFEKFEGIKVDDKSVDKKYYTAKSGSTIVTLSADYLNTLDIGEHRIAFVYDDGEVETTFKIAEKNITDTTNNANKNNPSTPKTGDASNMPLWIAGLTISGVLFVLVLGCKVKGTKRKSRH